MLKKILNITGRSGLFELKTYGKNMVIVESLVDHKRVPAYSRDKIVSLGDIAIYTTADDVPLAQVLESIRLKYNGQPLDKAQLKTNEQIDAFFAEVLPNYDADRVYRTDIKKIINWYNILVEAGYKQFVEPEAEGEAEAEAAGEPKNEPEQ